MSLLRQAAPPQFVDSLVQCNEATRPGCDEHKFFRSLCDGLVNAGLFQFAWFGYEDEVARKIIKPFAHSGDLHGFLEVLEAGLRSPDYEDSSNVALQSRETGWIGDLRDHPNPAPRHFAVLDPGC